MPRSFLVKRSHRPTPISYWTHCSCYPAAALEGGNQVQLLVPPPFPAPHFPSTASASESAEAALLPAPVVPQFGTPEDPSSPAPLHSPARAVSKEHSLHLASPVLAKSFPASEPLLLGPGGDLKLWAVTATTATIASGLPLAPQHSHGPSPGAPKRSQGRKAKAARKLHFEDEVSTLPMCRPKPSLFWRRLPREGVVAAATVAAVSRIHRFPGVVGVAAMENRRLPEPRNSPACVAPSASDARAPCVSTCRSITSPLTVCPRLRLLPEACLEEAVSYSHSPLSLSGERHLCPVCGETFPSKSGQERHLHVLHAAQVFPCKYCPTTFYSSPGLTRHINKCHPSENWQVILLQVPVRV
ncbi:insulinoma-associated protein 1 [Crotalus adamanteus]|uniref:Insulinoma-associated protein 1 n=1 Tax=Crotalus adamanteus TaxID=8729 RepID=A0AAW1BIT8_CROAD